MMGIGGTGVVTVNQILGTAALLDGKHVRGLDQTGLSQKGGPVVSHLKILGRAAQDVSNKVAAGAADCYLGFDILVATSPQNLDHARPDRTIAVVSTSQVPTGAMVTSTTVCTSPTPSGLVTSINRVTRKDENVYLRRARAGRDAVRRPHGRQHDRAGRRLPGRRHARSAPRRSRKPSR